MANKGLLSPLDLEVWQAKGLRADFSDVPQGKDLADEKEVEEGKEVEDCKGREKVRRSGARANWSATITTYFVSRGGPAKL